jgi:3-methyladenine DNA glycosylase AlkD
MITAKKILENLKAHADPAEAKKSSRYFKAGPGGYAMGDQFLGLALTDVRHAAKKYRESSWDELDRLIQSKYHEARATALSILTEKYKSEPEGAFKFYIAHTAWINNWDLVDMSAGKIVGAFCYETNDVGPIRKLAASGHLWSERIAIISTMPLIKRGEFKLTLELAVKFLKHKHDLIHKAVGWMLREIGKRNEKKLTAFLDQYAGKLPRTALRYSLEKLTPEQRKQYMEMKRG